MSAIGGQPPLHHRLHVRLTGLYALSFLVVLAGSAWITYHRDARREQGELQQRILSTATALSTALDPVVLQTFRSEADRDRPEFVAVERHLAAVAAVDPEFRNLYVMLRTAEPGIFTFAIDHDPDRPETVAEIGERYDARDLPELLAGLQGPSVESAISSDAWGPSLSGWVPLRGADGTSVGVLGIDVSGARIEEARRRVLLHAIASSALTLGLLAGLALVVGRSIRDPLQRLIEVSLQLSGGDLGARVALMRSDELGLIGQHFDRMAEGLEEREFIRDTLGRYVSEAVARKLLADRTRASLSGEVREVTVLFTDLRGYSTLAEQLPPAAVVTLLNRYLGAMTEVIQAHDGVVIEFLGDGILAVFGAPDALPDHPAAALRCTIAMASRLERLNADGDIPAKLIQRAGIHTGPVVAGNLGSPRRMKYAVIGDTVNVAARLEQLNKELGQEEGRQVLLSAAVHAHLPPELAAEVVYRGEHPLKGRQQRIGVWALRATHAAGLPAETTSSAQRV
jgi:adenylate cyclase